MKKIVIIGPAYPYRGGNSLFVSHLYELLKDSFEVVIYNYKLLYPSFLFPGTTQFDKSDKLIKKAPSIRVVNSVNPFNWMNVASKIKSENADMVIFDWWHPFFAPCHFTIATLLKWTSQSKLLFITENFVSHEGSPIDYTLTKIGLSRADGFLTLSEKVTRDIITSFPAKAVFQAELPIYDCYTSESPVYDRKHFGLTPEHKVLLFFGYIRHYKGLDILLRAMKELVQQDPSYRLLAVGESYEDPAIYTALIKELGIEEYVRFENIFVANEDVWKYYAVSDIVLLPYRSATQSGILNIAYGFLKPVIVTKVGGLAEFVDDGKTGFLAEPESFESLVASVNTFYGVRSSTPFTTYIQERLKANLFFKIPDMMRQFLNE